MSEACTKRISETHHRRLPTRSRRHAITKADTINIIDKLSMTCVQDLYKTTESLWVFSPSKRGAAAVKDPTFRKTKLVRSLHHMDLNYNSMAL